MTQQWNASIQHQVGTWMFDVTYAANKGNHFAGSSYDLNQVDPAVRLQLGQSLFTPVPNPYAGLVPGGLGAATITRENSLRAFPYYSSVTVRNPRLGNYMSHQLQFNVTKRMANGLLVNFAFTGGKKLSDSTLVPVDFGPIEQVTENGYQDGLYNRQLNKSVDPGDVSKRGVISALYELPFGAGRDGTRQWIPATRRGWMADQYNRCHANRHPAHRARSQQQRGQSSEFHRRKREDSITRRASAGSTPTRS